MSKRWSHKAVARELDVDEDIVRRIYGAVQLAKKQGLYGGHTVDLIERSVGRRLHGAEFTVANLARAHLGHAPPSGYGGPEPTGAAKAPPRVSYDDPKIQSAERMATIANKTIKDVLDRQSRGDWNEARDRDLLRGAADELDVAADLYEEAGANMRAGTLHQRAKFARLGHYKRLHVYDA